MSSLQARDEGTGGLPVARYVFRLSRLSTEAHAYSIGAILYGFCLYWTISAGVKKLLADE